MSPTPLVPPAHSDDLKVDFPRRHVLLLTLNRPKALNAMTPRMREDLTALLDWFEAEPELWVVIVTGAGRIFCAGADLKAWNEGQQSGASDEQDDIIRKYPQGFGSLSRRKSVKPIIAAVNGGAYGGGMEMVLNCDIVIAAHDAKFALPEVKRGVVAIQGGIPRLAQISGHQLACELLLLGKTIDAFDARNRFGFVNEVVPPETLLPTALSLAQEIIANSPDAVQSTKECLLISQAQQGLNETVLEHVMSRASTRVYKGDNIKEGLKAFTQKRPPAWKNPAKL